MPRHPIRLSWSAWLLASLVVLGCDPPGGRRPEQRSSEHKAARDPVADAALGDAKVVVLKDGTVEIYDRNGQLRARIIDPQARFVATLEPIAGTEEWAKPSPQLTVPIAGLSDWLTRRGDERRARTTLEAEGLTESHRMMVAIADAAETTEQGLAALEGELAALWSDTSKPAIERRRLLFERWDESEEAPEGTAAEVVRVQSAAVAPDAIRAQAGERARDAIEAFIRARLPAGSGDAYGAEELAALDRRRTSRQRFAPYGAQAKAGDATDG